MIPHLDPDLVAGFAAEARSHLPQIRQALDDEASDAEALDAAQRHLSSMRDASSMVGLAPLGRALELFAAKMLSRPQTLSAPLRMLDEYLESLEEHRDGLLEPQRLLEELSATDAGVDSKAGLPMPPPLANLDTEALTHAAEHDAKSSGDTISSQYEPGSVTPGQRMMHGVRSDSSYIHRLSNQPCSPR